MRRSSAGSRRQRHRRFIKTHTPLDGIPRHDSVTYICRDPSSARRGPVGSRSRREHARRPRESPSGEARPASPTPTSSCRRKGQRHPATTSDGSSTTTTSRRGAVRTGWPTTASRSRPIGTLGRRQRPPVPLRRHVDVDLDAEMRRVSDVLGIAIDEGRVAGLRSRRRRLDSMRSRAAIAAPNADAGMWRSPERFFEMGGTREWASHLTPGRSRPFPRSAPRPERRCRRVGAARSGRAGVVGSGLSSELGSRPITRSCAPLAR